MRIIIFGCGIVGRSLLELLKVRKKELNISYGLAPKILGVVDSKGFAINTEGLNIDEILRIKDLGRSVGEMENYGKKGAFELEILENIEFDLLIDMTPTNIVNGEPALSLIKRAFSLKLNVITTNKGPLALAMPLLLELAKHNNVSFRFSGTVGGGTPLLDFAKKCLMGDKILAIRGILNGTTNYILTEMEKGKEFSEALREAQVKGFAEADPSLDIDGIDSASKLVILANWILGKKITLKDVKVQGIRDIRVKDLEDAKKKGKTIKLIASVNGEAKVEAETIPKDSNLAVSGSLNAVSFISQYAGEETIIGRGAGGKETASSVIRDMIEIRGLMG